VVSEGIQAFRRSTVSVFLLRRASVRAACIHEDRLPRTGTDLALKIPKHRDHHQQQGEPPGFAEEPAPDVAGIITRFSVRRSGSRRNAAGRLAAD